MTIRSLSRIKQWAGKRVLLRLDLNVPLSGGRIIDDLRLRESQETIEYLVSRGARVVVISHLGEPTAGFDAAFSLRPVAQRLRRLLKRPVKFLAGEISADAFKKADRLKNGDILLLDNLRFSSAEYQNDVRWARWLAALGEVYVNDAFSASHRHQASLSAIKKYLPAYAGCHLEKEVRALEKVRRPKKPFVLVLGGVKLSTKAPLIAKFYSAAEKILIGGALANYFFKQQKLEIGRSHYENPDDPYAQKDLAVHFRKLTSRKGWQKKIILPADVVALGKNERLRVALPSDIHKDETILDIGPATIAIFARDIKRARTIAWNGPMGQFEDRRFRTGTVAVGSLIAARSSGIAYGVVGGGETVAGLELTKMSAYVDWISTAGGALLSYIGGAKMPGLAGIIKD